MSNDSETVSIDIPIIPVAIAIVAVIVLAVVAVSGILSPSSQDSVTVQSVDSATFEQAVADDDTFVLQVHTPYYGEIDGTDLVREDWNDVEGYLDQLPSDKSAQIAIYCRSGRMSGIVAEKLAKRGYTNIYDLDGGMNAWEASGRELITR